MAKSKDQLYAKIDNLFFDINAKYAALKSEDNLDKVELMLLEGDINYLSNFVRALSCFAGEKAVENSTNEVSGVVFTPPSLISDKVDAQPVYEEIIEQHVDSLKGGMDKESVGELATFDSFLQENEQKESPFVEEDKNVEAVVHEVVEEKKVLEVESGRSVKQLSINELIQKQKMAGVNMTQQFNTSNTQERAVDLKTAVSLNDKLLFIRDLFNGYSLAYSEALELLNRFTSFSEADAFLQSNYALKNGWADKQQTMEKFYALLRKKFTN